MMKNYIIKFILVKIFRLIIEIQCSYENGRLIKMAVLVSWLKN